MSQPEPSSPEDRNSSSSSQCRQCVRMLQKVLLSSDSRPLHLLKALGASKDQLVFEEDGTVTVNLPKQRQHGTKLIKRWSRLSPPDSSSLSSLENNNNNNNNPIRSNTPSCSSTAATTRLQLHPHESSSSSSSALHPALATSAKHNGNNDNNLDSIKIECRPCGTVGAEGGARAYVTGPDPLSIVMCTNRLANEEAEISEVLVHELMHVYDVRVQRLDLQTCENLAYSEVRAARQAECHGSWLKDYCVKQKAVAATVNLFPNQARDCVLNVFDKAMADTRPFAPEEKKSHKHENNWHSQR